MTGTEQKPASAVRQPPPSWQPNLTGFALALLILLFVLPLFSTLLLSFQTTADAEPFAGPYALAAWSDFLGDGALHMLLLRSLGLALLVAIAANLLALGPAYLVAVIGGPWRHATLLLCLTVLLGDQVTTVMGWSEISRHLMHTLTAADTQARHSFLGDLMTLLAEIHRALPLVILCQAWAMARHDPALIEVGLECGASHGRLLRWVIGPLLQPGLALGGFSAFAFSFVAALEPALLNTGAMSWGESLRQALDIEDNWPLAARFAILACLLLFALLALVATLLARGSAYRRHAEDRRQAHRLGPQDPMIALSLIPLFFLALPLLWMLVLSLRYLVGIAVTAGPLLFFQALADDPRLLPSVIPSLVATLAAALLAACGGAGLAALWRRLLTQRHDSQRQAWLDWLLLLLSALPLLLPSLLLSTSHLAAHLFLANYLPGGFGILAVTLADGVRAMPLAAVLIWIQWQRLPQDLDEIAAEFALDTDRLRRQIIRPSLQPAWALALLACAMLSLGDFQLANALSGERPMLGPSLLAGIATQRSPIYLALVGPLLVLTASLCHLILRRLDRRERIRAPQGGAGGFGLSMNITARKT